MRNRLHAISTALMLLISISVAAQQANTNPAGSLPPTSTPAQSGITERQSWLQLSGVLGAAGLLLIGSLTAALLQNRRAKDAREEAKALREQTAVLEASKLEVERQIAKLQADTQIEVAKIQSEAEAAKTQIMQELKSALVYKIGSVTMEANIIDIDGSVETYHSWDGIEVTRHGTTLSYFPGGIDFSRADCEITQHPDLGEHVLEPSNKGADVKLRPINPQPRSTSFKIIIPQGLHFGDSLRYEYTIKAKRAFYMTKEEVDALSMQDFRNELWSMKIEAWIGELTLRVDFPPNFTPLIHPGVWLGNIYDEDGMDRTELNRVIGGFQHAANWSWAKFVIKEPLIGFTYALYWTPPLKP